MVKRARLEIIRDILKMIQSNRNTIKPTPLLRKSGLSSAGFKEYYAELVRRGFVTEQKEGEKKKIVLTERGVRFIEKYKTIVEFIEEFEL